MVGQQQQEEEQYYETHRLPTIYCMVVVYNINIIRATTGRTMMKFSTLQQTFASRDNKDVQRIVQQQQQKVVLEDNIF